MKLSLKSVFRDGDLRSCSNEATAKDDYKYKLRRSLSKGGPVHCCSNNRLLSNFAHESEFESNRDNLGFSKIFQNKSFPSENRFSPQRPSFSCADHQIRHKLSCLSLNKTLVEGIFCFAYLAGSVLEENKARKFAFLIGFYSENYISV